jgi:hypothetical protein
VPLAAGATITRPITTSPPWVSGSRAQIGHQLIVLPGHQVVGIAQQILPIDVLIDAFLFDDENLVAQAQDRVELLFAEVVVVFADPIDCHGVFSHRCLFLIVGVAANAV